MCIDTRTFQLDTLHKCLYVSIHFIFADFVTIATVLGVGILGMYYLICTLHVGKEATNI